MDLHLGAMHKLSHPKPDTRICDHNQHANIKLKPDINKNRLNFYKSFPFSFSFFFFFFFENSRSIKTKKRDTQKTTYYTASTWITSNTHWGISSIQTSSELTLKALRAKV